MKHRKESQEYNANDFKYTDLDHDGYVEWEEYERPVSVRLVCTYNSI